MPLRTISKWNLICDDIGVCSVRSVRLLLAPPHTHHRGKRALKARLSSSRFARALEIDFFPLRSTSNENGERNIEGGEWRCGNGGIAPDFMKIHRPLYPQTSPPPVIASYGFRWRLFQSAKKRWSRLMDNDQKPIERKKTSTGRIHIIRSSEQGGWRPFGRRL